MLPEISLMNLLNEPSLFRVEVFDDFAFNTRIELSLLSDEVHVWRAFLDREELHFDELAETLSEDERIKAERFCFQRDRERFVITHGILRNLLGRYLNVEPNRLRFSYGRHGKPTISRLTGGHSLCFNMSHSHGLAMFAFAWGRKLGVDVEYIRPMPDAEQIAGRFFSPRENVALRAVPVSKKLEAFFNCWTQKEAFLKATGEGLSRPLDGFDVSLVPDEPALLLSIEGDKLEASRWSLRSLGPAEDYVGALAFEGRGCLLAGWHWQWHK